MFDRIKEIGLNDTDIEVLDNIDKNVMKIDNIINLMIKTHNYGFSKGVKESIKCMDTIQKRESYE